MVEMNFYATYTRVHKEFIKIDQDVEQVQPQQQLIHFRQAFTKGNLTNEQQ